MSQAAMNEYVKGLDDENERLRAEVERLTGANEGQHHTITTQNTTIASLRAELAMAITTAREEGRKAGLEEAVASVEAFAALDMVGTKDAIAIAEALLALKDEESWK